MKKIVLFVAVLLAAILVFAACAGKPEQPAATTEPTNIPTTAPTTVPTQAPQPTAAPTSEPTTMPTVAPTTAPTNDGITVNRELADSEAYTQYNTTPKTCIMIRYEEGKSGGDYVYPGKEFNTAGMKDGALYVVHDGEVYPVTEQYVTERIKTSEHIYYVLQDDAEKIWRTDLYGKNPTVVYESEYGAVTYLQYFGINAQGKLILAENRNRIIMYDLKTKNFDVLMEAYLIGQFVYSPSGKEFSYSEPMVFWKGKLKESDPETEYTYHYLINTEKQVQIHL